MSKIVSMDVSLNRTSIVSSTFCVEKGSSNIDTDKMKCYNNINKTNLNR